MSDVAAAIRAKLDARTGGWGTFVHCDCGECKAVNAALLAVLELHKPYHVDGYKGAKGWDHCSHCQNANWGGPEVDWPCDTVEAVAKALGIQEA